MTKTAWTSIGAMLLGGALIVSGCASQNNGGHDQVNENATQLTGSYVPESAERDGPVTNGKNNVRVIDRSDLENSGGADVQDSLRQLGVH